VEPNTKREGEISRTLGGKLGRNEEVDEKKIYPYLLSKRPS